MQTLLKRLQMELIESLFFLEYKHLRVKMVPALDEVYGMILLHMMQMAIEKEP